MDFQSPSVTMIVDFLLQFFQDRKLQPSTIESDMVGDDKLNISKDENHLLDRFYKDKPKDRRGVSIWNLPLVSPAY